MSDDSIVRYCVLGDYLINRGVPKERFEHFESTNYEKSLKLASNPVMQVDHILPGLAPFEVVDEDFDNMKLCFLVEYYHNALDGSFQSILILVSLCDEKDVVVEVFQFIEFVIEHHTYKLTTLNKNSVFNQILALIKGDVIRQIEDIDHYLVNDKIFVTEEEFCFIMRPSNLLIYTKTFLNASAYSASP
jgi:hypothetical protein